MLGRRTTRVRRTLALGLLIAGALVVAPTANATAPERTQGSVPVATAEPEVRAAAVYNDTRATAQASGRDLRWFQNTVGAVNEETITCGAAATQFDGTVWYRFTGNGGRVVIDTFGSNFDTMLGVYSDFSNFPFGGSCNDDQPASLQAQLSFTAQAGVEYYVVAACAGACDATNPRNLRLSILGADHASHPGGFPGGTGNSTNVGASTDTGELTNCNGTNFFRTTWHRIDVPEYGTMRLSASTGEFLPTVAFFLADGRTRLPGCQIGNPVSGIAATQATVGAGVYLAQVGSANGNQGNWTYTYTFEPDKDEDNDNQTRPLDCVDTDPTVYRGARDIRDGKSNDCDAHIDEDADNDGHEARWAGGRDCYPNNGSYPRGREIYGNAINEDCRNGVGYKRLPTDLESGVLNFGGGRFVLSRLRLHSLKRGTKIKATCRGTGCRRSSYSPPKLRRKRSSLDLMGAFGRGISFGSSTTIKIRVTKRYWVGKVFTLKRRGSGVPERHQCVRPGKKPKRC